MQTLSDLDTQLLLWCNSHNSPFTDQLFWTISGRYIWIPLYLFMAYMVIRRYGWHIGGIIVLSICIAVGASDYICASVIRPAVERMRPTNPDNPVSSMVHIVNDYRGGRFGFPSCHAANTFSLALFFALVMRRRWITFSILAWSVIVCYSRIHMGVHYPGDILCGMIMGTLITLIVYTACRLYLLRLHRTRRHRPTLMPIPFAPSLPFWRN